MLEFSHSYFQLLQIQKIKKLTIESWRQGFLSFQKDLIHVQHFLLLSRCERGRKCEMEMKTDFSKVLTTENGKVIIFLCYFILFKWFIFTQYMKNQNCILLISYTVFHHCWLISDLKMTEQNKHYIGGLWLGEVKEVKNQANLVFASS